MNKYRLLPESVQDDIDDAASERFKYARAGCYAIGAVSFLMIIGGAGVLAYNEGRALDKSPSVSTYRVADDYAAALVETGLDVLAADLCIGVGVKIAEVTTQRTMAANYISNLSSYSQEEIRRP